MPVKFTPAQDDAILYRNVDACVVAGPGAGKTTVLVERYRRLVEDRGFEFHQILAITFTEKAAANMKGKLAEKFSDNPVLRRDLESAWVSTIHGFCMRLLRENAIAAGLDPLFAVLSPRESDTLQWECLQGALDELTANDRESTLALIEALQSPYLTGDLRDVYDGIRSAGLTIEDVRTMPNPAAPVTAAPRMAAELHALVMAWPWGITPKQNDEKARLLEWCADLQQALPANFASFIHFSTSLNLNLTKVPRAVSPAMKDFRERFKLLETAEVDRHAAPFRAMIFDALARFDEEYRTRKNGLGRVDFNDLERHAIALLKNHPDIARKVRAQFRQVMIDEFQDINGQQAELVSLLRSDDIFFAVGDVNQSIYGFRHARPEIFLSYRDEVAFREAQSVALLHNFRSRQAILQCVRALLGNAEGMEDRDLISGASFAAKEAPSIEVMEIRDPEDDKDAACDREAAWIAHRIVSLRGTLQLGAPGETRPAEFGDFAVLCRNGDSMPPILAAFERAGIPYVCGRRQSFLLSRIGLDITALLNVMANPRDGISLATLLRSPLVGMGDESLLRLRLLAGSLTGGLNKFAHHIDSQTSLTEPDASRLTAFCRHLERWRQDQPIIPLDILLARALADCGLDWTPASSTGADIERFLHLARTTGAEMDLTSFLHELEGLADAADMESELSDEDQGDCVRVMTAHAAKGLEFPITIVAAMEKGARNESSPVTFTPEHGIGVKWRNPASKDNKEGLRDSWAEANSIVAGVRESHEENRLLYVAMTRAAEHLILSWSRGKNRASNWAKRADGYFNVSGRAPAADAAVEQKDGFDVAILVAEANPPLLTQVRAGTFDPGPQIIARPVITDQHETAATVTALTVFAACPRKYYIQRSLGWNSGRFRRFDPDDVAADTADDATTYADDHADLPAFRIGSAVHEILAGLAPSDDAPEARHLANVFLGSDLGSRAVAATRSAREWAFIVDIDSTILRGNIDLWFEENGEIQVVDYKTDDVSAEGARIRALDYASQLALYSIALERALGKRPKAAWLHFLRPDTVVEIPLNDIAISKALALVAGLRMAQDELRFDLKEGEHCRSCAFYRSLCPAGRENAILEEA